MENEEKDNKAKVVDSEGYNVEKPQDQNIPLYNSATTHRGSEELPGVENLNQDKGIKNDIKEEKYTNSDSSVPQNDDSLHGQAPKTDLGNGQRDKDEDEDEKIIRT